MRIANVIQTNGGTLINVNVSAFINVIVLAIKFGAVKAVLVSVPLKKCQQHQEQLQ